MPARRESWSVWASAIARGRSLGRPPASSRRSPEPRGGRNGNASWSRTVSRSFPFDDSALLDGATHILISAPPEAAGDPVLATLGERHGETLRRRVDRLPFDNGRLRRPARRLGERGGHARSRPGTVKAAPRRRARLARLRRRARRAGQHFPPRRDLRSRPKRARPAPRRLGTADRQTRPGILPGACRRCRGGAPRLDRPVAAGAGLQRRRRRTLLPAGGDRLRRQSARDARRLRRSPSRPRNSPHSRGASIPSAGESATTASSASSAWCFAIPPIARDLRSLAAP